MACGVWWGTLIARWGGSGRAIAFSVLRVAGLRSPVRGVVDVAVEVGAVLAW